MVGRRSYWAELTKRELEVLEAASQGLTCVETGKLLFLSPQSIKFYRKEVLVKLQAKNITHAVSSAYQLGILSISEKANIPSALTFIRRNDGTFLLITQYPEGGE